MVLWSGQQRQYLPTLHFIFSAYPECFFERAFFFHAVFVVLQVALSPKPNEIHKNIISQKNDSSLVIVPTKLLDSSLMSTNYH